MAIAAAEDISDLDDEDLPDDFFEDFENNDFLDGLEVLNDISPTIVPLKETNIVPIKETNAVSLREKSEERSKSEDKIKSEDRSKNGRCSTFLKNSLNSGLARKLSVILMELKNGEVVQKSEVKPNITNNKTLQPLLKVCHKRSRSPKRQQSPPKQYRRNSNSRSPKRDPSTPKYRRNSSGRSPTLQPSTPKYRRNSNSRSPTLQPSTPKYRRNSSSRSPKRPPSTPKYRRNSSNRSPKRQQSTPKHYRRNSSSRSPKRQQSTPKRRTPSIGRRDIFVRSKSRDRIVRSRSRNRRSVSRGRRIRSRSRQNRRSRSLDRRIRSRSRNRRSISRDRRDRSRSRNKRSKSRNRSRSRSRNIRPKSPGRQIRSRSRNRHSSSRNRRSRSANQRSRSRNQRSLSGNQRSRSGNQRSRSRNQRSRSRNQRSRSRNRKSWSRNRRSRSRDRPSRNYNSAGEQRVGRKSSEKNIVPRKPLTFLEELAQKFAAQGKPFPEAEALANINAQRNKSPNIFVNPMLSVENSATGTDASEWSNFSRPLVDMPPDLPMTNTAQQTMMPEINQSPIDMDLESSNSIDLMAIPLPPPIVKEESKELNTRYCDNEKNAFTCRDIVNLLKASDTQLMKPPDLRYLPTIISASLPKDTYLSPLQSMHNVEFSFDEKDKTPSYLTRLSDYTSNVVNTLGFNIKTDKFPVHLPPTDESIELPDDDILAFGIGTQTDPIKCERCIQNDSREYTDKGSQIAAVTYNSGCQTSTVQDPYPFAKMTTPQIYAVSNFIKIIKNNKSVPKNHGEAKDVRDRLFNIYQTCMGLDINSFPDNENSINLVNTKPEEVKSMKDTNMNHKPELSKEIEPQECEPNCLENQICSQLPNPLKPNDELNISVNTQDGDKQTQNSDQTDSITEDDSPIPKTIGSTSEAKCQNNGNESGSESLNVIEGTNSSSKEKSSSNSDCRNKASRNNPRGFARRRKYFQNRRELKKKISQTVILSTENSTSYADVLINGAPYNGILHKSGDISILGSVYIQMLQNPDFQIHQLSASIKTDCGKTLRVIGYSNTNITYLDKTKVIRLHIAPELSQRVYLGMDFTKAFEVESTVST